MKKFIILALVGILELSCVRTAYLPFQNSIYPPSEKVDIYYGKLPNIPYEEMGIITADSRIRGEIYAGESSLFRGIVDKAKQLGADGIIITKVSGYQGGHTSPNINAILIKYLKK